jgi:hypothetical protein
MATITVKGFATKIFWEGKAVTVTEYFQTKNDETAQRTYTAWFEKPVSFDVGVEGVFSGLHSAVIEDWKNPDGSIKLDREGKPGRSVKVSINGTTFAPSGANISAPKVPSDWSAVPDDMPF